MIPPVNAHATDEMRENTKIIVERKGWEYSAFCRIGDVRAMNWTIEGEGQYMNLLNGCLSFDQALALAEEKNIMWLSSGAEDYTKEEEYTRIKVSGWYSKNCDLIHETPDPHDHAALLRALVKYGEKQ